MVTLNRIYTKTGDSGTTRLATGESVSKADLRVEAYGAVDETNACIGLARVHTAGDFDALLARVQNELFDLGADLATPAKPDEAPGAMLRILDSQVARLEAEIDDLNDQLPALASFVLPAGPPAAACAPLRATSRPFTWTHARSAATRKRPKSPRRRRIGSPPAAPGCTIRSFVAG